VPRSPVSTGMVGRVPHYVLLYSRKDEEDQDDNDNDSGIGKQQPPTLPIRQVDVKRPSTRRLISEVLPLASFTKIPNESSREGPSKPRYIPPRLLDAPSFTCPSSTQGLFGIQLPLQFLQNNNYNLTLPLAIRLPPIAKTQNITLDLYPMLISDFTIVSHCLLVSTIDHNHCAYDSGNKGSLRLPERLE
ncbi:hypothetical protein PV326_007245, partial [Microctonus aethiopoides]